MSQRLITALLTLAPLSAWAEAAPPPGAPSAISQILFLGGFVLIFYFLVWRPQSKRAKEHKALIEGLSKGDEVLVNGGLAGKIVRIKDDFVVIEIADGVEAKVQKMAITAMLPKGTLKDI